MAKRLPFQNPCNGLDPKVYKKDYHYEAYRLADCTLLDKGSKGAKEGKEGIEHMTLVEYDSRLYAYGGIDHNDQNPPTVLIYDIRDGTWRFPRPPDPVVANLAFTPQSRMSHSAVVFEKGMFVFGGWNKFLALNDLWQFRFDLEMWFPRLVVAPVPQGRMQHGVSLMGNMMTIFGGLNPMIPVCPAVRDMWTVNLTHEVPQVPPPWKQIEYFGSLPINCQGVNVTSQQFIFVWEWKSAVLSKFDHLSRTWTEVMYDEHLSGHFLLSLRSNIYCFGGVVNNFLSNELKVWDTRNGEAKRFWLGDNDGDMAMPPARRNHAGVAVGDSIFTFGGRDEERKLCDLWVLKVWEEDGEGMPVRLD